MGRKQSLTGRAINWVLSAPFTWTCIAYKWVLFPFPEKIYFPYTTTTTQTPALNVNFLILLHKTLDIVLIFLYYSHKSLCFQSELDMILISLYYLQGPANENISNTYFSIVFFAFFCYNHGVGFLPSLFIEVYLSALPLHGFNGINWFTGNTQWGYLWFGFSCIHLLLVAHLFTQSSCEF